MTLSYLPITSTSNLRTSILPISILPPSMMTSSDTVDTPRRCWIWIQGRQIGCNKTVYRNRIIQGKLYDDDSVVGKLGVEVDKVDMW